MLKSVPSVRDALTLIQEVTGLCNRGRFKLIKFVSSKKDMMFQIPDTLKTDSLKKQFD